MTNKLRTQGLFSRKIKLLIIELTGLLIIIGIIGYSLKSDTDVSYPKPEEAAENPKTQEIQPQELTPDQLEEYYQTYNNPFVMHVRKALNGYLAGTNEGLSDPDDVGLDSFSKDYYRGKFVVVWFDNSIAGGKDISILFQDKPDKLFTAWVYKTAVGEYELRAFWQSSTYTDEKLQELNKRFKTYLEDKDHAL